MGDTQKPKMVFPPTPPSVRPTLGFVEPPAIALAPAAAGAAAAAAGAGIVARPFRETPVFFVERAPDGRLVEVSVEHPETSTFVMPDGKKFIDYALNHKLESMGVKEDEGAFGKIRKINIGGVDFILKFIPSYLPLLAKNEIEMLMKVDGSPYVLQLLAGIVFAGKAYILSPYIPGLTLDKWLPLHTDDAERKRVYNALLDGIEYIHSKGVVHRDIKPQNIFVPTDTRNPPFFLDFGISIPLGTVAIFQGTEKYKPAYAWGAEKPQTEMLNYYALGVIFKDNPVSANTLGVNLKNESLTTNAIKGKRYSRRGRKARAKKTRRQRRQRR
jgi:serine/threonine protein kinase